MKTMGPNTNTSNPTEHLPGVDAELLRPPAPDIPIDQLMRAVESTKPHVRARLLRIGRLEDVDDVMQDVRLAAWEGLVRGHYRQIPGVSFGAWVQGVAGHLCGEHIRRTLSHPSLPLLLDNGKLGASPVDFASTESMDRVLEREWVGWVLATARKHVAVETWDLAVRSMTETRSRGSEGLSDATDRRRWHAISVVRHTAQTVKAASEMKEACLAGAQDITVAAVASLPTALLRLVAERVVLTGVRGSNRAHAIAAVASEVGLSLRYVEVKIGLARNLVNAALDVLQHGTPAATEPSSVPGSWAIEADIRSAADSVLR